MDRSAAYATRHVAKNLVAAGLCDEALVQVAYAIGVAEPVSVRVQTNGTAAEGVTDARLAEVVRQSVDLRPRAIIERFELKRPIYTPTAAYGHFGRSDFPWEGLSLVEALGDAAAELA